MLYRDGLRNDNDIFVMIQKRESSETLTEGQVSVTDNKISNNDIFPATFVFKQNISFRFKSDDKCSDFVFGLCDKNNYYRNILINQQHRTIRRSRNGGSGDVMAFDLPKIQEHDVIQFTYDKRSMYLKINDVTHTVWDISDYQIDEWYTYCYMSGGTIVYQLMP